MALYLAFSTIMFQPAECKRRYDPQKLAAISQKRRVRNSGLDWTGIRASQMHDGSGAKFRGFFIPAKESDEAGLKVD